METMPLGLQKTAEAFGFAGASAKNDLYEFDSNKVKEASREIFKIIADYQGKLKELQDMNLSPEEYKKQAQALLDAAQEAIKAAP